MPEVSLFSLLIIMMVMTVPIKAEDRKHEDPMTLLTMSDGITPTGDHVTGLVHVPSVPKKWYRKSSENRWNPFRMLTFQGPVKLPLVINLHALGANAYVQMQLTDFNKVADDEGFIVLYPNGRSLSNIPNRLAEVNETVSKYVPTKSKLKETLKESLFFGSSNLVALELDVLVDLAAGIFLQGRSWNVGGYCGDATDEQQNDIQFLTEQIDYVQNTMPLSPYHNFEVDMERIYVTGMSNSGFMTHLVACEMSDMIAVAFNLIRDTDCWDSYQIWKKLEHHEKSDLNDRSTEWRREPSI